MPTTAKVVCDSISESGVRLVTLVLEYPRIIHSEFMTHRMFSRNASSSRAIPVEKQIERVENDYFLPSQFGKNMKGMQAKEDLVDKVLSDSKLAWRNAKNSAIYYASKLTGLGVHKQLANRLLEPFSHIQVVVTATEWDNFFLQRLDKNAQPEIQELARVMKEAMENSTPKLLKAGEWHLPFITDDDWFNVGKIHGIERKYNFSEALSILIKVSVARCARVSYGLNERGWGDIDKDLSLYEMLLTNNHWSPFEHQATPMKEAHFLYKEEIEKGVTSISVPQGALWSNNFKGWVQNRALIQQSLNF